MLQRLETIDADLLDREPAPAPVVMPTSPSAVLPPVRAVPTLGSTANFMDFRFQLGTQDGIMGQIAARAPDDAFAYVVTPNVDHVVRIQHLRSDLWPAYRHAWMTLCDSRILARLAARTGLRLPVMPGSDLTSALFGTVIAPDDRIAILGGDAATVDDLCARYGLTNVFHHVPSMGFIESPADAARAVDFLVATRARYSFLAVGSPQQEMIAYRVAKLGLAIGIGFCVGASLDFLTGRQRRAPRAMQKVALEWLFRLLSNPRRLWRRYLVDGPLILHVYRSWRRRSRALR
ncbi:WecB/TagA/CpsF family glycosyltransferase [Sphingomonas arantia]|uniref:WecB/TagA/CpsF family glycosyltransferase n=1 Tax=Sphingomonas arantia TaxID=1460676 RepID=A0ABW4U0N5_9SPHN